MHEHIKIFVRSMHNLRALICKNYYFAVLHDSLNNDKLRVK